MNFKKIILILCLAFLAWSFYTVFTFPSVNILKKSYPVMKYQGVGKEPVVEWVPQKPRDWVLIGAIPKAVQGAVITSEDWAFFQHEGFDLNQLQEVAEESIKKKHFTRGASTLTQQVVKNIFLTREKTISRKVKELFLSMELEDGFPKKKILEVYFNIAEWGEGIYGVQKASLHYFSKPVSALNAKEAAFLAILLPNPKKNSSSFRKKELTPFARRGIDRVLLRMVQAGYLSEEQRQVARNQALPFERVPQVVQESGTSTEDSGEEEIDDGQ